MAMNMDAMLRIKADVQGENNIRRLGNSMQGLQGQVKNTSMAVAGLGAAFKGLGAALAVGGFTAAIKGAIDLADDMRDLSQQTGVGIETLGQFKVAAELSGTSIEGVAKSLGKLNQNMVNAATGNKDMAANFAYLGISVKNADGTLKSADQVLLQVADSFSKMKDGAVKNSLAVDLLGKSGRQLIPLLNLGSKEIQRFGLGIGPDFADKADAFNDSLGIMKAQVTVLTVQIGSALLPVLSGLVTVVGQVATFVGTMATEFYKAIGGAAGLQQIAATLIKTMVVLGSVTAGVFIATNVTTFATALGGVLKVLRPMVILQRTLLAIETARASVLGVIAALQTPGPAQTKAIAAVAAGTLGTFALVAGVGKMIDDLTKRIGDTLGKGLQMPNIPTPAPGTTPDITGLRTGDGGRQKAKDEAARRKEALLDSQEALKQSRGELAVARETNPVKKIALEYEEKRRALIAASDKAFRQALSGEQQANIQRQRSIDLRRLEIERINAGTQAFKDFYGAGFEAGMSGELFYISVEKTTSAMEDFNAGISSYIESIGTLGANLSNVALGAFKGLEDAITSLVTTGTFNFRQFAISIIEEATRMITRLVIIAPILQSIKNLTSGGGNLLGVASGLNPSVGFGTGITGFAKGGIVSKPTMFAFANGGSGQFGLMGESGAEAIMPLKRGRDGKLGVAGGGGVKVGEINITVQNTGESLSPLAQKQVATQVQNLVLATLANEKRSGGMLR